ncbi:MAG: hypothetical protein WBA87_13630 [Microbacterium sp.]
MNLGQPLLADATEADAPEVEETQIDLRGDTGFVHMRVLKPYGVHGLMPVMLYLCGRMLDDRGSEGRLVREFAVGAGTAVVLMEHRRSSLARSSVVVHTYTAVRWLAEFGATHGLDASRVAIAADFSDRTASARRRSGSVFADGPHLSGRAMAWFWEHYCPDPDGMTGVTGSQIPSTAFAMRK